MNKLSELEQYVNLLLTSSEENYTKVNEELDGIINHDLPAVLDQEEAIQDTLYLIKKKIEEME